MLGDPRHVLRPWAACLTRPEHAGHVASQMSLFTRAFIVVQQTPASAIVSSWRGAVAPEIAQQHHPGRHRHLPCDHRLPEEWWRLGNLLEGLGGARHYQGVIRSLFSTLGVWEGALLRGAPALIQPANYNGAVHGPHGYRTPRRRLREVGDCREPCPDGPGGPVPVRYLGILRSVHDALDLKLSVDHAKHCLSGNLQGHMIYTGPGSFLFVCAGVLVSDKPASS